MLSRTLLPVAVLACAAACSPDIRPAELGDGGAMPVVDRPGGSSANNERLTHTRDGAALVTRVDATASDQWVYVDLDRGEMAGVAMEGWDLQLQRFKIKSNGGVSGTGGVEIARLAGVTFDGVTTVPTSGWLTDVADGADGNTDPDYVFDQQDTWYAYNVMDHSLSPRDLVYVVRTTERRVFKLKLTGYYDMAGTSGFVSFRWQEIATPDGGAQ